MERRLDELHEKKLIFEKKFFFGVWAALKVGQRPQNG
jgi:hypothetical protein